MALHVISAAWHSVAMAVWPTLYVMHLGTIISGQNFPPECVLAVLAALALTRAMPCTDMLYTGMLVNFETMKAARRKHWQGQKPRQWAGKLLSFVMLAKVKASALAKDVASVVACTMANILVNTACIHDQIFYEQSLAAEDKLKHTAAVAYGLQQHGALTMVKQKQWQRQSQGNGNDRLVSFVVLAMVKASAMAKDLIIPLACTMAKTVGEQKTQQLHSNGSSNTQHVMAAAFDNRWKQQHSAAGGSSYIHQQMEAQTFISRWEQHSSAGDSSNIH